MARSDVSQLSSKVEPASEPALGAAGWLRWAWRQLTSMRVALMLLLLLAVAALPGSFFPQQGQDAAAVGEYRAEHPALAAWLERLGFFDVYSSPWFVAVYSLLFVSLIGCIVPRIRVHARQLRQPPPRVPARFSRFPVHAERVSPLAPEDALAAARSALGRRFRVRSSPDGISAERGYLRETGNILFHLSLIGLLLAFAGGQAFSYRGQAIVTESESFANSVVEYDTFTPGSLFEATSLEPFAFTLEEFTAEFTADAQARDFAAHVTVTEPDGDERAETIRVNHPMNAGGANVYLSGNGYAPEITVRDSAGEVAFSGPVPFLPEDSAYTSRGVVKVPDVSPGQPQLGFNGFLLPTAVVGDDGSAVGSGYPQPQNPLLVLSVWAGDLGLDEGVPQNVYELDTSGMEEVLVPGSDEQLTIMVAPGETVELPDGLGTITFESLPRFAALDLRYDPSLPWLLASAVAAMLGLAASLFVPRRRLWVRVRRDEGRTVVAGAALARGDDLGLAGELDRVLDAAAPPSGRTTTTAGAEGPGTPATTAAGGHPGAAGASSADRTDDAPVAPRTKES